MCILCSLENELSIFPRFRKNTIYILKNFQNARYIFQISKLFQNYPEIGVYNINTIWRQHNLKYGPHIRLEKYLSWLTPTWNFVTSVAIYVPYLKLWYHQIMCSTININVNEYKIYYMCMRGTESQKRLQNKKNNIKNSVQQSGHKMIRCSATRKCSK